MEKKISFSEILKKYTMVIVLVFVVIMFSVNTKGVMLLPQNVNNLVAQNAYVFILATGMLFCILTGGNIDLSVGSVVCFVAAVGGKMMVLNSMNPYLTMIVMLLVGIAIGAWQGFWIAYVRIPPFIVTLAGMLAFRGLSNVVLEGQTLAPMPDAYLALFNNYIPDFLGGGEGFNRTCFVVGIIVCIVYVALVMKNRADRAKKGYSVESFGGVAVKMVLICVVVLAFMFRLAQYKGIPNSLLWVAVIIAIYTYIASKTTKSPTQILRDMSKQLRKEVYKTAFELSERFPEKPSLEAGLDEEIAYTRELLQVLEEGIKSCGNKKIQKLSHEMKELLEDERLKEIRSKDDKDARFGHKTATSTFYGYKNHLAMTEERLIAGITVTDGGAPDGQELPKLIENAKENGIKVTEVIGDMAYVSDDNLEVCGKEITLIARTNTAVAAAANGNLEEGFCFNKDAGMLQCPAGELSTRVEKRTAKNGNTYLRYIFSKVTCRKCPQREKCRVGRSNAKTRSYSITQASEKNLERLKFEESEYFQERMKIRHRIEEKNGELKEAHGLRKADSRGLFAMHLQMYFTAFTANVKRIVRLEELAME